MATEPRPTETCTGEVCVGDDVRPNVIAGGVGEDAVGATLNQDAAGPDAPDAPSSFASDKPATQDASLGQRHVASAQHQMTAGSSVPSILLGLALLGALAWRYCKHRMQQKEWQRASVGQLEKIRLRNADTPAKDDGKRMGKEPECSQVDAASNICDEGNISSNDNSPDVPTSDRISRIRAKQQDQLERNARERHLQQKKKKKALHNLLDHAAADAARERRKSLMAEESKLLERRRNEGQQQNALSEQEELDRTALLQSRIWITKNRCSKTKSERCWWQRRGIFDGEEKRRWSRPGTDSPWPEFSVIQYSVTLQMRSLAVNRSAGEHLLWKQEQSEIEDADLGDVDAWAEDAANGEQSDCDLQSAANSYASIRNEWRGIFHPFSVSSTFPQRTFDNLFETLEDGGLGQGATVMVVVESD